MTAEGDADDRTQAATPRRLEQARADGNVPVSREAVTFAGLAGATLVLSFAAPATKPVMARLAVFFSQLDTMTGTEAPQVMPALIGACVAGALLAAPFLVASLSAGVLSVLFQTGFLFNLKGLQPDVARINPLAGLKRLVGPENGVEALRSLIKTTAIAWVVWLVLSRDTKLLATLPQLDIAGLASYLGQEATRVLLAVVALQAAIAGFDLFWVRFRHARRLRMSRQDLRDESKDTEGDPRVKARLRQLRLQRARRRMLAAVSQATVVVTNPTHYAIALAYDRNKNAAPRVVAKGVDSMAARIREAAEKNGVPLVANPPLARALFHVPLDADIPAEHFQAVAEIIAYVWKLSARVTDARRAAVR